MSDPGGSHAASRSERVGDDHRRNGAADDRRNRVAGDRGNGTGDDRRNGPAGDVRVTDDLATIEQLQARVAELDDNWRRALADLDNFRKRAARDAATQREDERKRVTSALLPIIDSLDLALEHAGADPQTIVDGIRVVRDQAAEVLSSLGFDRRDNTGERFDPARHEAVAVVDDPVAAPGTVVQVIRPGYGEGEHQLRPASVVVASGVDDGG